MKRFISMLCLVALITGCSKDNEPELKITVTVSANNILHNGVEETFQASTSENVDEVIFYFDGQSIGSSISNPYRIKFIPKNISAGSHKIACIAKKDTKSFNGETTVNVVLRLGDEFQGGKIFHLEATGDHGLIGSLEDMYHQNDKSDVGFIWGGSGTLLGTDLDNGKTNTTKMARISTSSDYAGYIFKSTYSFNGYNDWYIPSYNELIILSENKEYIGTFTRSDTNWENYYWSSSESNETEAFCLNFFALSGNTSDKGLNKKVRLIRQF